MMVGEAVLLLVGVILLGTVIVAYADDEECI